MLRLWHFPRSGPFTHLNGLLGTLQARYLAAVSWGFIPSNCLVTPERESVSRGGAETQNPVQVLCCPHTGLNLTRPDFMT